VAEHDDIGARRPVLVVGKRPPDEGLYSEHSEVVAGHDDACHVHGFWPTREHRVLRIAGSHDLEDPIAFRPVDVVGGGDADPEPAWPLFRYLDDTLRLREVEWSQQR
jgi:hypothetical protein